MPDPGREHPLVVDVDGSLLRTDLLWEGLCQLAVRRPARLAGLPFALFRGRAAVKAYVARHGRPALDSLPLEPAVSDLIREAAGGGRPVALVSGADQSQLDSIGKRVGAALTWGSDGTVNLTGSRKLSRIRERWPRFDYVGNDLADIPLWKAADRAYAVNPGPATRWLARRARPDLIVLGEARGAWRAVIRALRPHQWAKNLLLLMPALAGHLPLTSPRWIPLLFGMVAFSLTASAVYVVNDLVDLPHDRRHPTKHRRPFAAGELGIPTGALLAAALLAGAAVLSLRLPAEFALTLVVYLGLSVFYSAALKSRPILDVITLATLYTLRVIAGSVLVEIPLSRWFIAFSVFLFLSLALVKRVAEVQNDPGRVSLPGRDYSASDIPVLVSFGLAATVATALVYCLYITGEDVTRQYSRPDLLWAGLPLGLYWQARLCLLALRNAIREDPVVFGLRDHVSRLAAGMFLLIVLLAI